MHGSSAGSRVQVSGEKWSASLLLGEFRHSLDAKGRVFIPSKWREELGAGGVVVAKGLDTCLYVMSEVRFREFAGRLDNLPPERRNNRAYSRLLYSGASEETMDKQGRITVPAGLREYAGLTREVVMVGVSERAEIWDRDTWTSYHGEIQQEYESIAEQLSVKEEADDGAH